MYQHLTAGTGEQRHSYLLSVDVCERHRLVGRHGRKLTDFLPFPALRITAAAVCGSCFLRRRSGWVRSGLRMRRTAPG